MVRLLSPCEGRVVKGVAYHGTENQGEADTEAAFAIRVGQSHSGFARHIAFERSGDARGGGRCRRLVCGHRVEERRRGVRAAVPGTQRARKRVPAARLGGRAPRAGEDRRHVEAAACRVPGFLPVRRVAVDGLRPFLQAVSVVCGGQRRHVEGGAQGRFDDRGGLGRADIGDRGSGDRGERDRLPVRGVPAVRPVRIRGACAGYGGDDVAALPCGDVRVAGRLHAAAGARQPQDRRDRPSA